MVISSNIVGFFQRQT